MAVLLDTDAEVASIEVTGSQLHGGWCPKGRRAEDGAIPERYPLRATGSRDHSQRTEWNVRDSDATVNRPHRLCECGQDRSALRWSRTGGDFARSRR